MEARIWNTSIALLLFFALVIADGKVFRETCRRLSAGDSILIPLETCSILEFWSVIEESIGVVEGDENALLRAASIVISNREEYVAVLFYASWCPFSKICLPNFNSMVYLFPSIPHFAFEESAIRPSILSRYGVHGFPTLFLLHSSTRVRYHGSRSITSLTAFYSNVTGMKPTSMDQNATKKALYSTNITEHSLEQESCPFSWARSPEKLLRQDTYLALACSFVALRLLYFFVPKLLGCAKRAWRGQMRFVSSVSLWDYSRVLLHQASQVFGGLNSGKTNNLKEAKAWASKSLASVSIGEPSVRAQSSG